MPRLRYSLPESSRNRGPGRRTKRIRGRFRRIHEFIRSANIIRRRMATTIWFGSTPLADLFDRVSNFRCCRDSKPLCISGPQCAIGIWRMRRFGARGALLAAVLELAYSVWLISIPHSTSLWASMFVLTIVATMYGAAAVLVLGLAARA